MSTNIPEGNEGALSRVVSGIADSVADASAGSSGGCANQVAGDMVRNVASGIDQVFKAVFGNLHKHSLAGAGSQRPAFSSNSYETALNVDIMALKKQIDGMRSEAVRLMQSDNKFDRVRGKNELEVAAELVQSFVENAGTANADSGATGQRGAVTAEDETGQMGLRSGAQQDEKLLTAKGAKGGRYGRNGRRLCLILLLEATTAAGVFSSGVLQARLRRGCLRR